MYEKIVVSQGKPDVFDWLDVMHMLCSPQGWAGDRPLQKELLSETLRESHDWKKQGPEDFENGRDFV